MLLSVVTPENTEQLPPNQEADKITQGTIFLFFTNVDIDVLS